MQTFGDAVDVVEVTDDLRGVLDLFIGPADATQLFDLVGTHLAWEKRQLYGEVTHGPIGHRQFGQAIIVNQLVGA